MLSRIGVRPPIIRHVCCVRAQCVFSVIAMSYPWILSNKSQGTLMILTHYNLLDNIYIYRYQTFKLVAFSRRSSQVSSCWIYHPAFFTHGTQICSICILGNGYNLCTWVVSSASEITSEEGLPPTWTRLPCLGTVELGRVESVILVKLLLPLLSNADISQRSRPTLAWGSLCHQEPNAQAVWYLL